MGCLYYANYINALQQQLVVWRNWLARGTNNAKVVGSSPIMTKFF